jgi:LexA-binding, inner membrane-associated putative hydrolase
MFIGHFGVGLAAKKFSPRASLGTLFFAAQFLDLIWPIFLLVGLEHVRTVPGITKMTPFDFYDYPISHSLVGALGWSVLVGGVYFGLRRSSRAALVVGFAVLSHWLLDLLVHRPDLPLWPRGPKVGLGLWNFWLAEISLEVAIFALGIWAYTSITRARDGIGRYGLWALLAFLFFGWVASLKAGAPPDMRAMAWGALAMWILVPWAGWVDRHREVMTR